MIEYQLSKNVEVLSMLTIAFSALTLLVRCQEEDPDCKNLSDEVRVATHLENLEKSGNSKVVR